MEPKTCFQTRQWYRIRESSESRKLDKARMASLAAVINLIFLEFRGASSLGICFELTLVLASCFPAFFREAFLSLADTTLLAQLRLAIDQTVATKATRVSLYV